MSFQRVNLKIYPFCVSVHPGIQSTNPHIIYVSYQFCPVLTEFLVKHKKPNFKPEAENCRNAQQPLTITKIKPSAPLKMITTLSCKGKMEWDIDGWIGAVTCRILIYQLIYTVLVTNCHELLLITARMRSQMQVTKINFLTLTSPLGRR